VELLFCSQADATQVFKRTGTMPEIAHGMLELSKALYVVLTFAEQGAMLWDRKEWQHEPARPTRNLDRLGGGDALAQA
jgi:sugar/nucleoside kinase (ribokinase family)